MERNVLNELEVKLGFRQVLFAIDAVKGIKLKFPNRPFEPPNISPGSSDLPLYIEETFHILDETDSSTDTTESIGYFTWMVGTPKGRGTEEAEELARKIKAAYPSGTAIVYGDTTIKLEHIERSEFQQDPNIPNWIQKPVSIFWRVFTTH